MNDLDFLFDLMTEVFGRTLWNQEIRSIMLWHSKQIKLSEIVKAYGKMMKKCEKPSFAYMSKIIENKISGAL